MVDLCLSNIVSALIIGILILILLERKKKNKNSHKGTEEVQKQTLGNTTKPEIETDATTAAEEVRKENSTTTTTTTTAAATTAAATTTTTSSCSSSSEEDVGKAVKVAKKPKKKHACKGSALVCATKRKVTEVTIVTDSEEQEVQVSLEELAGEMRKNGVTCNVHPAFTHLLPSISTEPSHLLLLFGTTSKGCEGLQEALKTALGGGGGDGGGGGSLPPPQPFLYSVTCWSDAATGEVYESSIKLSSSLASLGGAEWLPLTCITTTTTTTSHTHTDDPPLPPPPPPPVMTSQHYLSTVMDKITKPAKKCCGTSCGTKTVDIEDLGSSILLLPPHRTAAAAITS